MNKVREGTFRYLYLSCTWVKVRLGTPPFRGVPSRTHVPSTRKGD
jgi:hypothetical protein